MKYSLVFLFLAIGLLYSCGIMHEKNVGKQKSEIIDIEVDKLGDYYTIDTKGIVVKYQNGKQLFKYSNFNLGELSAVDATNPHKILLFYKEQQTIVLLDNSLSEISEILLDNNSFFSAIGLANDGNIWVYDSFLSKLKKIDSSGKEIEESFPVSKINPDDIVDSKIIDRGNYVIVADRGRGILLFNNMGFFDKIIAVENISKPTILKNKLYYFNREENCYISQGLDVFSNREKLCFDKYKIKPKLVLYENQKFYMLFDNGVKIYSTKYFN